MPTSEIRMANGDAFNVQGSLEEVEKKLSDAARSGQSRLAWFNEPATGASLGINPAHVTALRASQASG